ncbi:MAG: C4-type zinc ribbon domain-containing protein [Acidobacteriota bacterium]|nr:C4-type zinc ribbon domain-containing protein [Acidobacteriota bacterium]
MLPDLKLVVRLQDVDNRASELTREVAALPKHISEIEKKLDGHERKLEANRAALSANQKDRKRLEGDIQIHEQKISKLKGQMADAKTNEVYRTFQHEIEFCEKEIRGCEDRILELMTESDPLEKNVKAAEAALKEEKKDVESEKNRARERTAVDQQALSELEAERNSIATQISPAVMSAYDRIRKTRGGVAIAEAVDGRCAKCHIALRPQFRQELKRGEKVMFCESCNRILYYNPPQSVEELVGQSSQTA